MQEEFYIGQIFETEYPSEALTWCQENNAKIMEIDPITKDVEEEYQTIEEEVVPETEVDGNIVPEHTETRVATKTRSVEKTLRRFEIQAIPEPAAPTKEQQSERRRVAYIAEKDPITCQIQSLRDEEQTEEVVAEINKLIEERAEVVAEIKERYPYPVEE